MSTPDPRADTGARVYALLSAYYPNSDRPRPSLEQIGAVFAALRVVLDDPARRGAALVALGLGST